MLDVYRESICMRRPRKLMHLIPQKNSANYSNTSFGPQCNSQYASLDVGYKEEHREKSR